MKARRGGRRRGEEWKQFRNAQVLILQDGKYTLSSTEETSDPTTKRSTTVCIHCGSAVSSKAGRLRSHLAQCDKYIATLGTDGAMFPNQVLVISSNYWLLVNRAGLWVQRASWLDLGEPEWRCRCLTGLCSKQRLQANQQSLLVERWWGKPRWKFCYHRSSFSQVSLWLRSSIEHCGEPTPLRSTAQIEPKLCTSGQGSASRSVSGGREGQDDGEQ